MYLTDMGAVLPADRSRKIDDPQRKQAGGFAAIIRNVLNGIVRRRRRRREVLYRRAFEELPDRMLRDIGVERDGRQRMNPRLHSPPF